MSHPDYTEDDVARMSRFDKYAEHGARRPHGVCLLVALIALAATAVLVVYPAIWRDGAVPWYAPYLTCAVATVAGSLSVILAEDEPAKRATNGRRPITRGM